MKIKKIERDKTPGSNQLAIIHKGSVERSKHLHLISKEHVPKITHVKQSSSIRSPNRTKQKDLDFQLESINILVDEGKSFSEASTVTEFIILSICKAFKFRPWQSLGLLAEDYKQLDLIIQKGKHGDYSDIRRWFNILIDNCPTMCKVLEQECLNSPTSQVPAVLKLIKLGTKSEDFHSTELAMKLFVLTLQHLSSTYLSGHCWEWVNTEESSLASLIQSFGSHPQLSSKISEILVMLGQDHLEDLLLNKLKRQVP